MIMIMANTGGHYAWQFVCSKTGALVAGLLAIKILLLLRHLALPKPLPGIPYNQDSARRLLGDIPLMKAAPYRRHWTWSQPYVHNSPLAQVFLIPFRRPQVVLSDPREVIDICSRRTSEFDRGHRTRDIIGVTAPKFHFGMESRDKSLRFHKELIRDLMAPKFLNEVSAPRVYKNFINLVQLWTLKTEKSRGRPFEASHDLYLAALDTICSVAFGLEDEKTSLRQQLAHTEPQTPQMSLANTAIPASFTSASLDSELEALLDIPEMMATAQRNPFPWLAQRLRLLRPRHAKAMWFRKKLIWEETKKSLKKLTEKGEVSKTCALDHLIWREMLSARRAGREPDFYSPVIRDETLGFLLGGHDSTATVLSWWVKYMALFPKYQALLRLRLRQAHAEAHLEERRPTVEEIVSASVPCLDAVIEETLRVASVATLVVRVSTCDTQILGYPIPEGTNVIMALTGPSLTTPSLPCIPLNKSAGTVPPWNDADIQQFRPERWLRHLADGGEVFDAKAGLNLAFSAGPRACFGKRLAYLQLKIAATLLVWSFDFNERKRKKNMQNGKKKQLRRGQHCLLTVKNDPPRAMASIQNAVYMMSGLYGLPIRAQQRRKTQIKTMISKAVV